MVRIIKNLEYYILKYKWEFLRRNENYRKDYLAIKKIQNSSNNKSSKYRKESLRESNFGSYFTFKYGINNAASPQFTYEEVSKRKEFCPMLFCNLVDGQFSSAATLLTDSPYYKWVFNSHDRICPVRKIRVKGITINKSSGFKAVVKWNNSLPGLLNKFEKMIKEHKFTRKDIPAQIKVRLDLDMRKEDVMGGVSKIIDEWNALRKKAGLLKQKRFDFDRYDGYLKVYDLRKSGWSWEKIARTMYQSDVERGDINYAKLKVKRDYERCKRLVDDGYRQIR